MPLSTFTLTVWLASFRLTSSQCPQDFLPQIINGFAQQCSNGFRVFCPEPYNCVNGWCCSLKPTATNPSSNSGGEGTFKVTCPKGGDLEETSNGGARRCDVTNQCSIGFECTAVAGLTFRYCCGTEETSKNRDLKCPNNGHKYKETDGSFRLCERAKDCPVGFACVSNSTSDDGPSAGVCCTQVDCPDNRILSVSSRTIANTCLQDRDQCPKDFTCAAFVGKVHGYCCFEPLDAAECDLKLDPGVKCAKKAKVKTRWYFDGKKDSCRKFEFNGCQGNANNFLDFKTCYESCGGQKNETTAGKLSTVTTTKKPDKTTKAATAKKTTKKTTTKKPTTTTEVPRSFFEETDESAGIVYSGNPCPQKRSPQKLKDGRLKVCPVVGTTIFCAKKHSCLMATRLGVGICCKNT